MSHVPPIREVEASGIAPLLDQLVRLLQDSVEGGASVGFLPPLAEKEACVHWQDVEREVAAGHRVLLVAEENSKVLGSVQLDLACKPNARHRAEVIKLLVLKEARRRGIGAALMRAVEQSARTRGRTLLVLDTRRGDDADRLYRSLGWTVGGVVPRYAASATGKLADTVFFYRELEPASAVRLRELEAVDTAAVHRWLSDINIIRYMSFALHTYEEAKALVRDSRLGKPYLTRQNLVRGIASTSTGHLLGMCGLLIDESREQAEAWYLLDPSHSGRGHATEATRQLLALGFGEFGLHRIWAGVLPENPASARVLEKSGFRKEGVMRRAVRIHGEWRDEEVYGMLREDWA